MLAIAVFEKLLIVQQCLLTINPGLNKPLLQITKTSSFIDHNKSLMIQTTDSQRGVRTSRHSHFQEQDTI
jgi:hypothetical protein